MTAIGPTYYKGLGRLHFAGEYTCYRFVGYMEGGLYDSGALARRLAERNGADELVRRRHRYALMQKPNQLQRGLRKQST